MSSQPSRQTVRQRAAAARGASAERLDRARICRRAWGTFVLDSGAAGRQPFSLHKAYHAKWQRVDCPQPHTFPKRHAGPIPHNVDSRHDRQSRQVEPDPGPSGFHGPFSLASRNLYPLFPRPLGSPQRSAHWPFTSCSLPVIASPGQARRSRKRKGNGLRLVAYQSGVVVLAAGGGPIRLCRCP